MIAFLKGKLIDKGEEFAILDVNGVGYSVYLPARLVNDFKLGKEIELHIHHHVREDAHDLYGFLSKQELGLFKNLLNVKGVGPKTALSVLHEADGGAISQAVAAGDPAMLAQTAGIGLKTAERIVVDLKNKVLPFEGEKEVTAWKQHQEVVEALVSLGYSNHQAQSAVKNLPAELTDTQDLLKEALKSLSGK